MSRELLLEHNAPLITPPSMWKVELVQPEQFNESLIESYIATTESRFTAIAESLLNCGSVTEEQAKTFLTTFKDQFVKDLREAHVSRRLRVSGPAQVENKRNGNGRIYPTALWDRVLSEDSDFSERLRNRQVLGELEHPTEGNTRLPRVSHLVEKVWRNNGVVYAQHLIFRTPNGAIVEELYNAGHCPGVSSRGAGSTRSVNGDDVVEESDFHLDTWDFVAQPSVVTARPSRIRESSVPRRTISVSGGANLGEENVSLLDRHGEPSMTAVLIESSNALANAQVVLKTTDSILEGKSTVADLMRGQQSVVDLLVSMGSKTVPTELAQEFTVVRSRLAERADSLRREINRRLQEADDETDDNPVKPPEMDKSNDDKPDMDDDLPADGNMQTERLVRLIRAEGLRAPSVVEAMLELAETVVHLRRQTEGQVPEAKYRTAIQLGEAIVARAKSDRKVYESKIAKLTKTVTESRRSAGAHRTLLNAVVSRYRTEQVAGAVDNLIEDNPRLKSVEKRLRECRDMGELNTLVRSTVQPLVEGAQRRPELPLPSLHESRGRTGSSPKPQQASGNLMDYLTESEKVGHTAT